MLVSKSAASLLVLVFLSLCWSFFHLHTVALYKGVPRQAAKRERWSFEFPGVHVGLEGASLLTGCPSGVLLCAELKQACCH